MALPAEDGGKVCPITPEQLERLNKSTIVSQLPLRYANGFVLTNFIGSCSICLSPIESSDLHGTIVQPFKSVAIVEAVGMCRSCKVFSPFFMRIMDDGTRETFDSKGNWKVERHQPAPLTQRKFLCLILVSILVVYFSISIAR